MAKKSAKREAGEVDSPDDVDEKVAAAAGGPADGAAAAGDGGAAEAQEHFGIRPEAAEASADVFDSGEEEPKTLAEASDEFLAKTNRDMEAAGVRGTSHPLYQEVSDEIARREAASDQTPAVPSELGKVVDCGHNPIPLGRAAHEVDCGHNPGKQGHPHKVIFRDDGSASVHDAKGQAIHHGTHRTALAAIEKAGVDWKTLPEKRGQPADEGAGEGGGAA